jgi:cytochrome b561
MAIIIVSLFILGKYMVGLDYYDNYYHIAPWWHKSFGLLIAMLLIFRLIWRNTNPKVHTLISHKTYEIKLAKVMQLLLYLLIIICCTSGILISSAEGADIRFFDLFKLPALLSMGGEQTEIAEEIHEFATTALIVVTSLHMLAAIKHHFINKDRTLIRILTSK